MKGFPFASMVLVLLAGVCFIMFIMFNFAFQNPDSGLFTLLEESASGNMNPSHYSWFGTRLDHIIVGFGFSSVLLFTLAILVAVATAMGKGTEE